LTIIAFRTHDTDKRAQLEQLAGELGALVVWPGEWQPVRLTKRQQEILDFVRDLQRDLGGAVQTDVIADNFVITPGTVRNHMKPLKRAGLISHPVVDGRARERSGWVAVSPRIEAHQEALTKAA
jgi:DNA-binding CsgD family transcriptional regulator